MRIAKALKAGEDPNLSNPTPEPSSTQELPPLDPNDPDVQALSGGPNPSHQSTHTFRQPSVEDVPDEQDQLEHQTVRNSASGQSSHLPETPSIPHTSKHDYTSTRAAPPPPVIPVDDYYQGAANGEVSPLGPLGADRTASAGGGYFPNVPDGYSDEKPLVLPEAPPIDPGSSPAVDIMNSSSPPHLSVFDHSASDLPHDPLETPNQSIYEGSTTTSQYPLSPRQPLYPIQPPGAPNSTSAPVHQQPTHPMITPQHHTQVQPNKPQPVVEKYNEDDDSRSEALKVIKAARSALDFEDVPTAVRLLRDALKTLGAG